MVVNIEFLGAEPIENYITCLNYHIDRVIFWGYKAEVAAERKCITQFLAKYCAINDVQFYELPENNLQGILDTMRDVVVKEKNAGNEIYCDITGGDSLSLVAFGILANELWIPIHQFHVENNQIIELNDKSDVYISKNVPERRVLVTLDMIIEMHGGKINYALHKDIKTDGNPENEKDISALYGVFSKHKSEWAHFSALLREVLAPENGSLQVSKEVKDVLITLSNGKSAIKNLSQLNFMLDDLSQAGVLKDLQHANGAYKFHYKNERIKEYLWDAGAILELQEYREMKDSYEQCQVGVHLDWDGVLHDETDKDVLNEIDILAIKGNIPTFVSCKCGQMKPQIALHALYELETVAERFGGRYANKMLITSQALNAIHLERAKEMGIVVKTV